MGEPNIKFDLLVETVVKVKIPVDIYKNFILTWIRLARLCAFLHYFVSSHDFGFWPDSFLQDIPNTVYVAK